MKMVCFCEKVHFRFLYTPLLIPVTTTGTTPIHLLPVIQGAIDVERILGTDIGNGEPSGYV